MKTGKIRGALVLAATVVAMFAFASPAWAAVSFDRTDYSTGSNSKEAVVGDFDEDGNPDLAATSDGIGGGSAAVALSDGQGGFGAPGFFGVGGNAPRSLRTADLDGDGHLDLFTANGSQTSSVSVLLGNGDGTFEDRRDFAVGSFPTSAVSADFDEDGNPDLAAASQLDNLLTILLGDGGGSFTSAGTIGFGSLTQQLAAGDFNNDGHADVAGVNAGSNNGTLALGNGDGTFQAPTAFSTGEFPGSIVAGDFNGDGNPDLATANVSPGTVSVLIGDGNGGFSRNDFGVGAGPRGVTVGDFDRDGNQDLAAANLDANSVSVLLGDGAGGFSSGGTTTVGSNPWFLAAGDLNGDTVDDLAVPNSGVDTTSVLINASLQADLRLVKEASAPALQGEEFTYRLTVTNDGPDIALGARVEDPLPAGVEFVSASPGCAEANGVVTCGVGDVPDGESRVVEIVVRPVGAAEFTNAATVNSRTSDPAPENNAADATVTVLPAADIGIIKAASADTVNQGASLSWTIEARNSGPATATQLRLVDKLPPNVEITEINSFGCTVTGERETGQTVTCDYGNSISLDKDGSVSLAIITVKVLGAGDLLNTATISAAEADADEANNTATVRTTVVPSNGAPAATDDRYTVARDGKLVVGAPGVLANDTDPEDDRLLATLVSGPSKGDLKLDPDGSFTYLPDRGFAGEDSFVYRAADGSGGEDAATVTIGVRPANAAPVATGDSYRVNEDATLNVRRPGVLANDSDADGDRLAAVLVGRPRHGTLSMGRDGSFVYRPTADYSGPDSFSYRASDGKTRGNVATVGITVASRPEPRDTTAPRVIGTKTFARSKNGAKAGRIEVTFSEGMRPSTVNGRTFTLTKAGSKRPVRTTVRYDAGGRMAVLVPRGGLVPGARYVARVEGGRGGVEDRAGNAMRRDKVWSFTVRRR
jgi:uncharacterized repeat protein (TIGR01451 family)